MDPAQMDPSKKARIARLIVSATALAVYITWQIIFDHPFSIPLIYETRWYIVAGFAATIWCTLVTTFIADTMYTHLRPHVTWAQIVFAPIYMVYGCSIEAKLIGATLVLFVAACAAAGLRSSQDAIFVVIVYIAIYASTIFAPVAWDLRLNYALTPKPHPLGHMPRSTDSVFLISKPERSEDGVITAVAYVVDTSSKPLDVEQVNGGILIRGGRVELVVVPERMSVWRTILRPFGFIYDSNNAIFTRFDMYWRKRVDAHYRRLMAETVVQ
jgi:hypothetical protein